MIKLYLFACFLCGITLQVSSKSILQKILNGDDESNFELLTYNSYEDLERSFTNAHSGGPEWEEHKFQTPDRPYYLRQEIDENMKHESDEDFGTAEIDELYNYSKVDPVSFEDIHF